jgi:hypothetical protein
MFRRFPLAFLFVFLVCNMVLAQSPPIIPLTPDSAKITGVAVSAYVTPEIADTQFFASGDSIFLHDGELYFRARAAGRDFFVAKDEIIKHSDSLVVYQSLRLTPATLLAGASDTVAAKAERQRCTAITKNGSRCRRMALAGIDKCWQHKK